MPGSLKQIVFKDCTKASTAFTATAAQMGDSTTTTSPSPNAATRNLISTAMIPMTSVEPLDPRCRNNLYRLSPVDVLAFDLRMNQLANMTCYPPQASQWFSQQIHSPVKLGRQNRLSNAGRSRAGWTTTQLSPLTCPSEYTIASSSVKNKQSTYIYCCPSGFGWNGPADAGILYQCTSTPSILETVTMHYIDSPAGIPTSVITNWDSNIAGLGINGWDVKVEHTNKAVDAAFPQITAGSTVPTMPTIRSAGVIPREARKHSKDEKISAIIVVVVMFGIIFYLLFGPYLKKRLQKERGGTAVATCRAAPEADLELSCHRDGARRTDQPSAQRPVEPMELPQLHLSSRSTNKVTSEA